MSHKPRRQLLGQPPAVSHYRSVDLGCRVLGLGTVTMWRAIKAVSQLVVVTFAFWGALNGALDPQYAFAGMLVAYLGAEGVETIIASIGATSFEIVSDVGTDADDEDEPKTDGGEITYRRKQDKP